MTLSSRTYPLGKGLLPIELITLLYAAFTSVLLLIFRHEINHSLPLLGERCAIMCVIVVLMYADHRFNHRWLYFLRILFPLTLLSYWYPDTYHFCSVFPNLDPLFARIDEWIFGCQPAVEFSSLLSGRFWSEAFYLGYFSYYPLIFITCLLPFALYRSDSRRAWGQFEHISFVVVTAFYLYYLIYLFLPVAGPQFYYPAVGMSDILQGHFPFIGDYFVAHNTLPHAVHESGFFQSLVEGMQQAGERPTAAFPSSHVGMSSVFMLLLYRERRSIAYFFLPFYVLLCGATVYIRAHYFIDVVGGLLTALLFYYIAEWMWREAQKVRSGREVQ